MRDLLDHHEREMMMDLTGEARTVPRMLEDVPMVERSTVHGGSGGRDAGSTRQVVSLHDMSQPSPYFCSVVIDGREREINMPIGAAVSIVAHTVEHLWDAAVAYAAQAGPIPLVGMEEWVEGDVQFERRLREKALSCAWHDGDLAKDWSQRLDEIGQHWCVPPVSRHRLVRRD